jgi:NhaA family Na+:H+ antiporter
MHCSTCEAARVTDSLASLSRSFSNFFESEKSGGLLLIVCTVVSLVAANSSWGAQYRAFWEHRIAGLSVIHWVNDGLMAVFFLLIGLELERELYNGELSDFRNALLPIVAAFGGVCIPAATYYALNYGTPTAAGVGIPMATDIAFALGALALLGNRIPASLKVFLTALAVIDDLAAIAVIAVFYTAQLSPAYLLAALAVLGILVLLNRPLGVMSVVPYLGGGALMWFLMLKSGVHATIAGVLLAFAIPFSPKTDDERSPSHRMEHVLHKPVAFLILPLFALANTGVAIGPGWHDDLLTVSSLGIILGLVAGKPLGIAMASYLAVVTGLCRLPDAVSWPGIFGAGLLAGIGFTMSIFITNLAFPGWPAIINASIIAILVASLVSGALGLAWLKLVGAKGPDLSGSRS